MRKRLLCLCGLLLSVACDQTPLPFPIPTPLPTVLIPVVNPVLSAGTPSIPDSHGVPVPVVASRDSQGNVSEFIEGIVLVKPRTDADLIAFLDRYAGVVMDDDTIPEPPPELGITLTAEQRKPTEYVVRIDLSRVNMGDFIKNAGTQGLQGIMEFSSESGMQTFAGILDAKAVGFDATGDFVAHADQSPFPAGAYGVLFNSEERQTSAPGAAPVTYTDALTEPRWGATGSFSNVALAMQYVAAHGFQRRVNVAIIDGGFWLDAAGRALGTDSDWALPPQRPIQYDFTAEDAVADGPNIMGCGPGNPCFWHGTGAASVAAGFLDNRTGHAGTGGLVATPMLFKVNGSRDQRNEAIRTAVAWGADVVSMSFGGNCNLSCRIDDRDETPITDAINRGSRTVFLASAGNGAGPPGGPNVGYDVGAPAFYHPCTLDHVICVGALNDNATSAQAYSNFGNGVAIFAPTNLPVMSQPAANDNNTGGPAAPRTFGGTSASTPFVAGVAAMMKALNPNLTGDEVARIIIETARAGVAPANRCIDALAAVRRAAAGIPIINDRFEPNSLETTPRDLGASPPYNHFNLSLDTRDRDYFRFEAPGGSNMIVNLQYPAGLGTVSIFSLESLGGACGAPALLSQTADAANRGQTYVYSVPGGPMRLCVRSDAEIAYHLMISFVSAGTTADIYEPNNQVSQARYQFSLTSASDGLLRNVVSPRVTLNATIHTAAPADVDYYIVKGTRITTAETVFLEGFPAVRVYANDSAINLQVYNLNADGTQGAQVADVSGGSCVAEPLSVRLIADRFYLVRVASVTAGATGRYTLYNGIVGEPRRLPILTRDRLYEILNPGEPVFRVPQTPRFKVLIGNRAFAALAVRGAGLHLRLTNMAGDLVAEGAGLEGGVGERISLAATTANDVYALEVVDSGQQLDGESMLEWESAAALRESGNLIANPGAEIVVGGDPNQPIPAWDFTEGTPSIYFYNDEGPTAADPGPLERGMHLYAGGPNNTRSAMRQLVTIGPEWRDAIDAGRVKFRLAGYLGGRGTDSAAVKLSFRSSENRPRGESGLSALTALDRQGQTGLFAAETREPLPMDCNQIIVDLEFTGADPQYNHGYADNLELVLTEFAD